MLPRCNEDPQQTSCKRKQKATEESSDAADAVLGPTALEKTAAQPGETTVLQG